MSRPRLVLAAAALLVVTQTGAFDAVAVDRSLTADVVADDEAYLGFDQAATADDGVANLTVNVTNRFADGTTLETVVVAVDGATRSVGLLSVGETGSASFVGVDCDADVVVDAAGDGVEVRLTRAVDCG